LGGIYFFFNALMNVASWFVAATLYSVYFPAPANALAYGVNVSTAESMFNSNYSANFAGANTTGATPRISHATHFMLTSTPQVPTCLQARSATCRSS
jgi:hypothetical protein